MFSKSLSMSLLSTLLLISWRSSLAFSPAALNSCIHGVSSHSSARLLMVSQQQDSAFAAFADSLEQEQEQTQRLQTETTNNNTWQARLDALLDPTTSLADRQVLLSELLNANQEIRDSVQTALREGKIDPLLTPTQRRLQDGTRAVARQLTTDILPSLARSTPPSPQQISNILPKIGSRVLNALGSQAKRTLDEIQSDLQDPSRIPQKLSQQTEELRKEVNNVFLETPDLKGPQYTVVSTTHNNNGYEIRDYPKYTVASTNMGKVGEPISSLDDVTLSTGAAFNALAAYLFGANSESRTMEMTTPVTTTSRGEMRFYLHNNDRMSEFPQPLADTSNSQYDTGAVQIVEIPAARLAVRKFSGFVTEGEVARQKDMLLSLLLQDNVELDVPHGSVVPHVIFQYNPPYTIPIVRRNEIAIPVAMEESNTTTSHLETEWVMMEDAQDDVSPSDY